MVGCLFSHNNYHEPLHSVGETCEWLRNNHPNLLNNDMRNMQDAWKLAIRGAPPTFSRSQIYGLCLNMANSPAMNTRFLATTNSRSTPSPAMNTPNLVMTNSGFDPIKLRFKNNQSNSNKRSGVDNEFPANAYELTAKLTERIADCLRDKFNLDHSDKTLGISINMCYFLLNNRQLLYRNSCS